MQEPSIDTYRTDVACSNCGCPGFMEIPKGQRVVDTLCPACGCCNLQHCKRGPWAMTSPNNTMASVVEDLPRVVDAHK